MTQVAPLIDERTDVVVRTDAASLMEVISRAAADPNTDVDKLERLMAMYERITDRSAKVAFSQALAEMQPGLPVIAENGRIIITEKGTDKVIQSTGYALWEDINQAIRPLLQNHGFALSFRIGKDGDRVVVTGVLSHRMGHSEETTLSLPMDATGSKNNVQAIGSSVSYGKRYTACALLNITSRGEDDDAKTTGDPAKQQFKTGLAMGAHTIARKSAAQAKRDGDHERIQQELAFCQTEAALDAWYADFDQHTAQLPFSWLDPVRDEVEKRRNTILDLMAERTS
jgi:hypothetical protein